MKSDFRPGDGLRSRSGMYQCEEKYAGLAGIGAARHRSSDRQRLTEIGRNNLGTASEIAASEGSLLGLGLFCNG